MERTKKSKKKDRQFRLLFDEAFAKPSTFKKLSKRANVKHIIFDLSYTRQIEDEDIYREAVKSNRFVVTINYKHFKNFVLPKRPGIIAIPGELSNEDIDLLLSDFVTSHSPDDHYGRATKLSADSLNKLRKTKKK